MLDLHGADAMRRVSSSIGERVKDGIAGGVALVQQMKSDMPLDPVTRGGVDATLQDSRINKLPQVTIGLKAPRPASGNRAIKYGGKLLGDAHVVQANVNSSRSKEPCC